MVSVLWSCRSMFKNDRAGNGLSGAGSASGSILRISYSFCCMIKRSSGCNFFPLKSLCSMLIRSWFKFK